MSRTKLIHRKLPNYTIGEERFNMITHIVGGGLGIIMAAVCIVFSCCFGNSWDIVGCSIYSFTLLLVYSMSSIYHGIKPVTPKKVMQVLDHCAIYFLIAGTYTPIVLSAIRPIAPKIALILFGLVWGLAILAGTLTAIDLKTYQTFSMVCYIFMGWCIMLFPKTIMQAISLSGFWLLLIGGVVYSIGAVLYGIGKKKRYMHGVFHLFVVAGSILQFLSILTILQ